MTVGVLTVRIVVRHARSLKDKRRVVQSVLTRARRQFNVSAIESGTSDSRQHARLCFALAAHDRRAAEAALQRIVNLVQQRLDAELVDFQIETY